MRELKALVQSISNELAKKPKAEVSSEIKNEFDVVGEIEENDDLLSILETMNQYGSAHDYSFKKGQMYPSNVETIVCKYQDCNRSKNLKKGSTDSKEINEKVKIKDIDCPVSYKFNVSLGRGAILLKAHQIHNHNPVFPVKSELSMQIKAFMISSFKKDDFISEVKEVLENAFGCKLDYWKVYNEFRRLYPRLGSQDARKFIEFIEKNGGIHSEVLDSTDQSICKLFFQTKLMGENYKRFGDIILIDATYSTNHFSTPLIVISSVDENYRNILFGMALVNDETLPTYIWVLRTFFQINPKKPTLIISDSDKSLCSSIATEARCREHRLCS